MMPAHIQGVSRRAEWLIPTLLIALSLVPVAAGTKRLAEVAMGAAITEANARFFAVPLPVFIHVISAVPFCILGALQLAPAFRRRRPGWHRAIGRFLLPCGLGVAISGLWMAQFYPWPDGDGVALYALRLFFGWAMVLAIGIAAVAIRRRDFVTHGKWMIRGYAIGLGAGTQVLTHLPYFLLAGKPDELTKAALMGAGWVINVVVAEWFIRRSAWPRTGPPSRVERQGLTSVHGTRRMN